jgi:DNA-binding beta-propeller fold protein YncE
MWTANFGTDNVSKITSGGTHTEYSLPAGSRPYGIAFDGTYMWTANYEKNTISKIATF